MARSPQPARAKAAKVNNANNASTESPLRVLFAASELAPWVKTGGLGDVASALPAALRRIGLDVRVLLPLYPALRQALAGLDPVAELQHLGGELPAARLLAAHTPGPEGVPLLLLDCPALFERPGNPYLDGNGHDWPDNALRFGLLSRVAALLGSADCPIAWQPQVIHCNDWQTALAASHLHYDERPHAATLLTIHNLSFQGCYGAHLLGALGLPSHAWTMEGVEYYGQLSFLKGGLQHADWINTVSPGYAQEIQTPEGGMGLDGLLRWRSARLSGILNGIDTAHWNPASDPHLAAPYDMDALDGKARNKRALQRRHGLAESGSGSSGKRSKRNDLPLLGVISRLTEQKGLDLLPPLAAAIAALPAQLVVLGSGEHELETAFRAMARQYPDQFAVTIGYDEPLAHQIEAGADIFLMPSRFEPCGLNQMYSLRYGTPPLVRRTGGLADTVVDCTPATLADGSANGFVFEQATAGSLFAALQRAVATWQRPDDWKPLQRNGMAHDWSWNAPAQRYAEIYFRLCGVAQTQTRPAQKSGKPAARRRGKPQNE